MLLLPFIRLHWPALPSWRKVFSKSAGLQYVKYIIHYLAHTSLCMDSHTHSEQSPISHLYISYMVDKQAAISSRRILHTSTCWQQSLNKESESRRARLGVVLPFSLETATHRWNLSHQQAWKKKNLLYLDLLDLCPVYGAGQNPLLKPAL